MLLRKKILSIMANRILKNEEPKRMYEFALMHPDSNIKKLEDKIVKSNDFYMMYQFAKNVPGANVGRLENEIIKSGNMLLIYEFARDVKGADVRKLEDIIMKSDDLNTKCRFAFTVLGGEEKKVLDMAIKYRATNFLIEYVSINESMKFDEIFEYIVDYGTHRQCILLSQCCQNELSENQKDILEFAINVKNTNISKPQERELW